MFIFEIGNRLINIPHMVETERLATSKVRVTMVSGNSFDYEGPDADKLVDKLRELAKDPGIRASGGPIRYADNETGPGESSPGPSSAAG